MYILGKVFPGSSDVGVLWKVKTFEFLSENVFKCVQQKIQAMDATKQF